MNEDTKILLEDEIRYEITSLSSVEPGSQEHSAAVESLSKLYKLKLEEDRLFAEIKEKEMENNSDISVKRDQMNEAIKDRYFKLCLAGAELILPLIFYGVWMNRGFKFETTGTFTSQTFRNLFSRFKPTTK